MVGWCDGLSKVPVPGVPYLLLHCCFISTINISRLLENHNFPGLAVNPCLGDGAMVLGKRPVSGRPTNLD